VKIEKGLKKSTMKKNVIVKKARIDDSEDILNWRNDSLAREMFRSSDVVLQENHKEWFESTLKNKQRLLLICEDVSTAEKIGVIRLDLHKDQTEAEISLNISPQMRRKRYAKPCLEAALDYLLKTHPKCKKVIAEIKKINVGSKKSFEGVGFKMTSESDIFFQYHLNF
jgi:RimJ/RimL family protein N-acetyltransferase